jgi:hypothetical protein
MSFALDVIGPASRKPLKSLCGSDIGPDNRIASPLVW